MPAKYYTSELIRKEALKYKTRGEFSIKKPGAYQAARLQNILDEACSHMQSKYEVWTIET